ncbi:ribonuclease III [SAR202 cluster bacterium AC-409-J13_OGT_754m]|nr:ribonuclease III [SAR202 cluster bacterium AC-409-J13_OGT_754m]
MKAEEFQLKIGLKFKNPEFLIEALTHPSYLNESSTPIGGSYQRLEFLGDAILGSVVSLEIFKRYPDMSEGDLTRIRADLVREEALARIAYRLQLGEYFSMGRGEDSNQGRDRPSNLAAGFEALVGAIYIDQGSCVTTKFILDMLKDELDRIDKYGVSVDAKSELQGMAQSKWGKTPSYRVTGESGPSHERVFFVEVLVDGMVLGEGNGKRKLDAEQTAANAAIESLVDFNREED